MTLWCWIQNRSNTISVRYVCPIYFSFYNSTSPCIPILKICAPAQYCKFLLKSDISGIQHRATWYVPKITIKLYNMSTRAHQTFDEKFQNILSTFNVYRSNWRSTNHIYLHCTDEPVSDSSTNVQKLYYEHMCSKKIWNGCIKIIIFPPRAPCDLYHPKHTHQKIYFRYNSTFHFSCGAQKGLALQTNVFHCGSNPSVRISQSHSVVPVSYSFLTNFYWMFTSKWWIDHTNDMFFNQS